MRSFHFFSLFLFFFLLSSSSVFSAQNAANCNITSTLKLGSISAEVRCLQVAVGADADGKFGPLTKAAVAAWQANRPPLIADGVFGPLSRAVWLAESSSFSANSDLPAGCSSTFGYSPITGAKCDGTLSSAPPASIVKDIAPVPISANVEKTDLNLAKLARVVETVLEVNKRYGSSERELKLMADAIRQTVMNSDVDFDKEFEKMLIREASMGFHSQPLRIFDKITAKTLSFFRLKSRVAHAQALGFGGRLLAPIPCTASGGALWMLVITPLPPTNAVLVTYVTGTQGFASYNMPYTTNLLGTYVKPGTCPMLIGPAVVTINTDGTITPMLGSSPS
jgi:hypothetical protein